MSYQCLEEKVSVFFFVAVPIIIHLKRIWIEIFSGWDVCNGLYMYILNTLLMQKDRPCFLCGLFGHMSAACPERLCHRCNLPGHLSRECRERSARDICYKCGRSGHSPEVRTANSIFILVSPTIHFLI